MGTTDRESLTNQIGDPSKAIRIARISHARQRERKTLRTIMMSCANREGKTWSFIQESPADVDRSDYFCNCGGSAHHRCSRSLLLILEGKDSPN